MKLLVGKLEMQQLACLTRALSDCWLLEPQMHRLQAVQHHSLEVLLQERLRSEKEMELRLLQGVLQFH